MRRGLFALVGILVVIAAAVAAAGTWLAYHPDIVRDRAIVAVRRATGRDLTIGSVSLKFSLPPGVELRDVTLSNLYGYSRPEMLRAARATASLALLPLLSGRLELERLTVSQPDLLLERDTGGRPNWRFEPERAPPSAEPATAPTQPSRPASFNIQDVLVDGAHIGYHDAVGRAFALDVPQLAATFVTDATTAWEATVAAPGPTGPIRISGTTGQIFQPTPAALPFNLTAGGEGLRATARGSVGSGTLTAAIHLELEDGAAIRPGLRSLVLDATVPALNQPAQVATSMALNGAPLIATATLANPAQVLAGTDAPIEAAVTLAGASLNARGTLSLVLQGSALDVSIRVPDMTALGTALGVPLPPAQDVSVEAQAMAPVGVERGIALRGLRAGSPQGDVAGDLAINWVPRPMLRGTLVSQRLDVAGLRGLFRGALPVAEPALPAPAMTAAPAPAAERREIPDRPLPFAALRRADGDLQWSVARLLLDGVAFSGAEAHLVLNGGRLRLDPAGAAAPGGRVDGRLDVDASATPPTAAVVLRAPSVDLAPLLATSRLAGLATGRAEIDADLHASGDTARAMAASLDGYAGVVVLDGDVDNRAIIEQAGSALRGLPLDTSGRSRVRCLALRLQATGGSVQVSAGVLDATRLLLQAEGGLNLGDETLALLLRPTLRAGGAGVTVPVRLGGTLATPSVKADAQNGRSGVSIGETAGAADACGPALTVARGGRAGPDAGRAGTAETPEAGGCAAEPDALKRFWQTASAAPEGAHWSVTLDDKPLNIPGAGRLVVPSRALADAVAAEWAAAGGEPGGEMTMEDVPLTRLAGTAQERIAPRRGAVVDALTRYAESDLLCYRAEHPEALVARQGAEWDPWLDWTEATFDARLHATSGITHKPQPPSALHALRHAVASRSDAELAALGLAVPALGSLVLGLALAERALPAPRAHEVAMLDELFQAEKWGDDREALHRRRGVFEEVVLADRFMRLSAEP